MAKRLMVLATMLASMLAMAVPAFAQEAAQGQYDPEAQQPERAGVGEEFSGFGVIERIEGGFGLVLSAEDAIYLEGDVDFAAFEGEDVYVSGTITSVAPEILTVEQIEPVAPEGEEVAVTGVVFEDDDFSDGTLYNVRDEGSGEVYPLTGGPGLDLAPYLDQRATVYGTIVDEEPNGNVGTYLSVSRVELAGGAAGGGQGETTTMSETTTMGGTTMSETTTTGGTTMSETTMGTTTGTAEERYEDGGTPEQVGVDVNEDGVVSEADGEFAVQTSDEGVASTPDEGALPGTGGLVLPVAGLAGALLLYGGLLLRNRLAR